jgi:murein L,D-transpeptidase YcbB/YkuD
VDGAIAVLDVVARAAEDGLDVERYGIPAVREDLVRAGADLDSLAALDVRVSEVVLAYARDLALGRVDPAGIDSLWTSANTFDPVAVVAGAADSGTVSELPDRLRPPHAGYAALRGALGRYRALADTGGAGDSAAARARQIEANLERWRWLPRDLGRRHVMVNFAAFEAAAVEDGALVLRTRVVAGRRDWPTPIVSGPILVIVANPRWNVPREIAAREILPAIRADTAFLTREGMAVYRGARPVDPRSVDWAAVSDTAFPFRLVQAPGPRNPLGRVKLVFASPFNVALHDTPARALFERSERAASHGCVRLERATDLAMWVAGSERREALPAALAAPEERALPVENAVMVHLVYWTAWAGEDGVLEVRRDLYGWDERLTRALDRAALPVARYP